MLAADKREGTRLLSINNPRSFAFIRGLGWQDDYRCGQEQLEDKRGIRRLIRQ